MAYSKRTKRAALREVAEGVSILDVAKKHSMAAGTIGRWLKQAKERKRSYYTAKAGETPPSRIFHPPPVLDIAEAVVAPKTFTIKINGVSVEGLTEDTLVRVLKKLAA